MKRRRFGAALLVACAGAMIAAGCGGGSSSSIGIQLISSTGILMMDESQPNATPPSTSTLNFTANVGGDPKALGVTWSLPTGNQNSACAGNGCGTLSNMTPLSVTYTAPGNLTTTLSVVLTATSVADKSVTKTDTISIEIPPVFATTECNPVGVLPCALVNGNNGEPYSQNFTFTGGVEPYTYTISSGALPNCLQMEAASTGTTGTIVGTPCGSGKSTFTVQVVDSGGAPAVTQAFVITVAPPPTLSVINAPLPLGTIDSTYSGAVATQGGAPPLTWSLVVPNAASVPPGGLGGLPPGLTLDPRNGQITGIPINESAAAPPVVYPKTYYFNVQVQDSALPTSQIQPPLPAPFFSITIQATPPLQISTQPPLASGVTATAYSATLNATGGVPPYTWSIIQGQLPSGLSLSSQVNNTGNISGVPILVTSATFIVQVSDSEVNPANGNPAPAKTSAPFTIKITAGTTNNTLLSGQYAFLFRGFDSDGPVMLAGTLTANGAGMITAGGVDTNRISGVTLGAVIQPAGSATPPGSTYSIGSDGRGTMELATVFGQNAQLVTDYDLVIDSSGNVQFFEDYTTKTNNDMKLTHGEGVLKPVVGPSTFGGVNFSGNYAFVLPGYDLTGKPVALAGVIHSDGSDTLSPGTADFNDNGTYSSQLPLSGDYAFEGGIEGAAELTFAPNGPQTTLDFDFFFVTPSDLYFIETDNNMNTGLPTMFRLAGELILQQPGTAFNQSTMQGVSVVSGTGLDGSGNASIFAGLLTSTLCDGATPLSFSYDENDGGTLANRAFSGTCSIASNGRAGFGISSSDTFERPNGPLGSNWTATEGGFSIVMNSVMLSSQGADMRGSMYWNNNNGGPFANDQFSELTITTVGGVSSGLGPAVRMQTSGESYYALVPSGANIQLQLESSGVNSILATYPQQIKPGDVLRLAVQGTSLQAMINGTTIMTATDSTFASGSPGIAALNTTSPFSGGAWTGGNMATQRLATAYLTGPGQGFLIGSDAAVTTGRLEQQTSGPSFALTSFLGSYTLSAPFLAEAGVKSVLGQSTANGAGALSGVVDEIDPTGATSPNLDQPLTATFTNPAPNGRGALTATGTVPSGFPTDSIFYVVSPSSVRVVSADTADTHPELILLDH